MDNRLIYLFVYSDDYVIEEYSIKNFTRWVLVCSHFSNASNVGKLRSDICKKLIITEIHIEIYMGD